MLRKLLKWLAALLAILVLAVWLFVWQGLGVNPLEGRQAHLWELVSNEVDFYARWPGAKLLDEPLAESLSDEPGYGWLADARADLTRLSRDVAREVNPQIPGAAVTVNLEKDILDQEMAFAGTIRGNYADVRPDNFIGLMRIPGYLKFLSALKRDFVREKLPPDVRDRIEVVKGLYFKVNLTPQEAQQYLSWRSGRGRPEPNAIWFGRIRDVLLVSDVPEWIEAALLGGVQTLPADTYFQTEFIPYSVRPGDVELFIRPTLAQMMMYQHGRDDQPGPLPVIARFVPGQMAGDVTMQATPLRDAIAVKLLNNPPDQGFAKVTTPYLVKLYEREKADLRVDFSEDGIGRYIPKEGTVAAIVLHADPEILVDLIIDFIPRDLLANLDEQARLSLREKGQGYRDYRGLLLDLTKDLSDTHLVVIHRPKAFRGADYSTLDEGRMDIPMAQLHFTLVSRVKDNAIPDRTRDAILKNLRYIGLEPAMDANGQPLPPHPQGMYLSQPLLSTGNYDLVKPAYGAMSGGHKFFVFSSNIEGAEEILAAAADPAARLVSDPTVQAVAAHLPSDGTLGVLVRGRGVRNALWDRVRLEADLFLNLPAQFEVWYQQYKAQGKSDEEIDRLMIDEEARYKATKYPDFRDRYERLIAPLEAMDVAVLGATLGVGPTRQVKANAYLHFAVGPPPGAASGGAANAGTSGE